MGLVHLKLIIGMLQPQNTIKGSGWVPKALLNFQQIVGVEKYIFSILNIGFTSLFLYFMSVCWHKKIEHTDTWKQIFEIDDIPNKTFKNIWFWSFTLNIKNLLHL